MQAVTAAERETLAYITPRKGFGLVQKLGTTICLILVFAVALSSLLNYFNFEKNYSDIVRSRYAVLVKDLAHTVEYGLGLGLGLSTMDGVPELLAEVKAGDPQIRFVQVFDAQGQVLFDTGAAVGETVPAAWQAAAFRGEATAEWGLEDGGALLVGVPLRNSFNQLEGSLVLGFDKSEVALPVHQVLLSLLQQSAITIALFALLSVLLVMMMVRGLVRALKNMQSSLDAVLHGRPASFTAAQAERPIEHEFVEFQSALQESLRELGDAAATPGNPARTQPHYEPSDTL